MLGSIYDSGPRQVRREAWRLARAARFRCAACVLGPHQDRQASRTGLHQAMLAPRPVHCAHPRGLRCCPFLTGHRFCASSFAAIGMSRGAPHHPSGRENLSPSHSVSPSVHSQGHASSAAPVLGRHTRPAYSIKSARLGVSLEPNRRPPPEPNRRPYCMSRITPHKLSHRP